MSEQIATNGAAGEQAPAPNAAIRDAVRAAMQEAREAAAKAGISQLILTEAIMSGQIHLVFTQPTGEYIGRVIIEAKDIGGAGRMLTQGVQWVTERMLAMTAQQPPAPPQEPVEPPPP